MKAYRLKKIGESDKDAKVVIVKDVIPSGYEKVGGPVGGENILPLNLGEKDTFVPFVFNGPEIKTREEMVAAYEGQNVVPEPVERVSEDVIVKRRGRPKKEVEKEVEDDAA